MVISAQLDAALYEKYEGPLEGLDGVKLVIDTRNPGPADQHELGHAGVLRGGAIVGTHVADSIKTVKEIVKGKRSLMAGYGPRGQHAELGPGLYISAAPQLWLGRAHDKWDFLKTLTKLQLSKLLDALEQTVKGKEGITISKAEAGYAYRDIRYAREGKVDPGYLVSLSGQPYNIFFWQEDFLRPLGIEPASPPKQFEVHVQGKFAKIEGYTVAPGKMLRLLRQRGVDGAFFAGGFGSTPQLVVWNSKAVKSIKEAG
jgi:hypothetical protein